MRFGWTPSANPRTREPANPRTREPANPRTREPANPRTREPADMGAPGRMTETVSDFCDAPSHDVFVTEVRPERDYSPQKRTSKHPSAV
jgi:hypothetical protein